MKTFNFKKIITGISIFTMIFSAKANVSAMNCGSDADYKNSIHYQTLDPLVQSEIDQLHHQLTKVEYRLHQRNIDFGTVLEHIKGFLSRYSDGTWEKQAIAHVIGITTYENGDEKGYIVSSKLFGKFCGKCRSVIQRSFIAAGFDSKGIPPHVYNDLYKIFINNIGPDGRSEHADCYESRTWTFKFPKS